MAETPEIHRVQPSQMRARHMVMLQQMRNTAIQQRESKRAFLSWVEEGAFNPSLMVRRGFESLEARRKKTQREEQAEKAEENSLQVEKLEEVSEQFQKKNPELLSRSLQLLRSRIGVNDSKEEILRKVLEMYPDHSLADEALDFLLQTSSGDLAKKIQQAKQEFNAQFAREIKAGKNIASQAKAFSEQGLGSPTSLRNLYREVTGNPRDANTLFNELTGRFDYGKMKTLIDFLSTLWAEISNQKDPRLIEESSTVSFQKRESSKPF